MSRRRLLRGVIGGGALASVGGGALAFGSEVALDEQPRAWASTGGVVAGEPRIHTRAEWGAGGIRRAALVNTKNPDLIVIHHTASSNTADFSLSHAFRLSQTIQQFHMARRGWDDIGQHFTVSRGGYLMEGRNRTLEVMRGGGRPAGAAGYESMRTLGHVVGAHTLHHNWHTVGIENEGTYMTESTPPKLWEALTRLCAWLCSSYGLDPAKAIVGHRDLNTTSCPGNTLYAGLPALRRNVATLLSP